MQVEYTTLQKFLEWLLYGYMKFYITQDPKNTIDADIMFIKIDTADNMALNEFLSPLE